MLLICKLEPGQIKSREEKKNPAGEYVILITTPKEIRVWFKRVAGWLGVRLL